MHIKAVIYLCGILFLAGCGSSAPAPAEEEAFTTNVQAPPASVQLVQARRGAFPLRIFSSGVLKADQRAPVSLRTGGVIESLPIREGQFVQKGALLVQLDDDALQLRLAQTKVALDEAIIEKQDLLILQRGDPYNDNSVPPDKLATILTRSGYTRAQLAIQQAEQELAQCKVYAPFDGVIADLKVKPYQQVNAGQELCTLINPATFEAQFSLLEREAIQVSTGQTVKITPVTSSEVTFSGLITTINPVVSEQGLVTVRARVNAGTKNRLFEGMNVQVVIERNIPNQIIIPKSAVVLRSGRPVVFTYHEQDRLAKWNYVTIVHENDQEVAISEGIKAGDRVIFEGNLNLDHDAAVQVDTLGGRN